MLFMEIVQAPITMKKDYFWPVSKNYQSIIDAIVHPLILSLSPNLASCLTLPYLFSNNFLFIYQIGDGLDLCPIDTGMPHGLLMLQSHFFDFAVEHWFGCRATEPGFTGDIGTIEIWLMDWCDHTPDYGL